MELVFMLTVQNIVTRESVPKHAQKYIVSFANSRNLVMMREELVWCGPYTIGTIRS